MSNVLLIGNGAREHAIAEAVKRSNRQPRLFSFMKSNNPGIASLSEKFLLAITVILQPLMPLQRNAALILPSLARKTP